MMMQQDQPDDYVVATGETHSVREFCEESFKNLGITLKWQGEGENEKGIIDNIDKEKVEELLQDCKTPLKIGDIVIEVDPVYFRPTEVELLVGDPTKAKEKLNWQPKVKFKELVKIMIENDLALALIENQRNEWIKE
jgi:GDPmannose 4,6-dehydratase